MSEPKKSAWQLIKERCLKNPAWYGKGIKVVVMPVLECLAEASEPDWDDSLVKIGNEFLDKLFPEQQPTP